MKSFFEIRKHCCRVERTSVRPEARLQRLTMSSEPWENRMQTHDVLGKKAFVCILSLAALVTSLANPSLGWCSQESDSHGNHLSFHELTSLRLSDCEPRNSSWWVASTFMSVELYLPWAWKEMVRMTTNVRWWLYCNLCSHEGAESVSGVKVDEKEKAQLLEEQKAYDREEMNTERLMSTRNKILEFWQTLEWSEHVFATPPWH